MISNVSLKLELLRAGPGHVALHSLDTNTLAIACRAGVLRAEIDASGKGVGVDVQAIDTASKGGVAGNGVSISCIVDLVCAIIDRALLGGG